MTATAILARLEFAPLLPWPAIIALAALVLAAMLYCLWKRNPDWRLAAALVLLAVLADPRLIEERRQSLPDIVLVMVDDSPSQHLGQRPAQTAQALAELQAKLARQPNLEIRVHREPGGMDGTRLLSATQSALAELPRRRLAGIIMITDGRIHESASAPLGAPLHVLLTGGPQERDRRVVITRPPGFTLVGRHAQIRIRVDDPGFSGQAELMVRVDGQDYLLAQVPLNAEATIEVPIRHAGSVFVEVESPAPDGDLLPANNRAALAIPAVRDRMKVLLISGEPHSGERVWRNLLKSDPAVDLVHFTILRPPEKDDRTPIRELALITFPVRELFEEKLGDFDLVIFDRYRHRGVMASAYYERLAHYVRQGGALLVAVGPEYADRDGFADTALAELLPVAADGRMVEKSFVPKITATGRRHPVTSGLPAPAAWGPWLRQVGGHAKGGQVVLEGADGLPLLVLDQVAQGRVAQLLSDTVWLWSRGYGGGGPHDEMLRRLAHWLMREPELEAESLKADIHGDRLQVVRRSLADTIGQASVTAPDGTRAMVPLADQGDGSWRGEMKADQPGLWHVEADGQVALAAQGGIDSPELGEVTATADILRPTVEAGGGSIRFLAQGGVPDIRMGTPAAGSNDRWLSLIRRDDYVVRGVAQSPLLPAVLALVAVAAGLLLAWRQESR
ncbi:hypothetical protein [Magnetospirillum sp. 64-120]|uniref:hypothetical protein n=1 Tax=Magnetospirillum sp. 64-120 TaxID=1895778 RepID=UPI00092ADB63|nr:hypothetical protein [Magnetospirillum sp. 64-120]OJX79656.1 MAG: hypothetical protein BGO92_14535 [Magnetospirillum sp. 64-120]